jgi:hypothetical protein
VTGDNLLPENNKSKAIIVCFVEYVNQDLKRRAQDAWKKEEEWKNMWKWKKNKKQNGN